MAESLARRLVEPGCGGQNALVGLSQHLTMEQARRQEVGMAAAGGQHQGAALAPQTFNMHALLAEALAFSTAGSAPATAQHVGAATAAAAGPAVPALLPSHYMAAPMLQGGQLAAGGLPLLMMHNAAASAALPAAAAAASAAIEQPSWGANFLAERDHLLLSETTGASSSVEMTDLDFDYQPEERLNNALERLRAGTYSETDAEKDRFWEDLSRTWSQYLEDEVAGIGEGATGMTGALATANAAAKEYVFQANNPHVEEADPLGAGLEAMRQGRIPEAVLLFEAAAARDPQSAAAWRHLGVSLAEAERESDAIAACQRCLALEPNDRVALLSLARSFTNELRNSEAVHALISWLSGHPLYADLAVEDQSAAASGGAVLGGFASYAEFSRCERLLLAAAGRQSPGEPDAELQLALGVLYNLHGDFQRAIDSYKAALQTQPDDYLTWNKLGATLANSGRHEEAVQAYRRALSLAPGFVRARANLGIACHSLRAYDQALVNFAAALRLLRQPRSLPDGAVWELVRQTAARMALEPPTPIAGGGVGGDGGDIPFPHAERIAAIKAFIEARDLPGLCRAIGVSETD